MGSSESRRSVRRRRRKRPGGYRRLRQRVQDRLGAQVGIVESPDGVKMSEVLEAFVEPYLESADTEDGLRKLMTIAAVAWNASLLPKKDQEGMIDKVLAALPPEARADGKSIVKALMARKTRHFAEFRRMIIDFEVRTTRDGFYLQVASSPAGEPGTSKSGSGRRHLTDG